MVFVGTRVPVQSLLDAIPSTYKLSFHPLNFGLPAPI